MTAEYIWINLGIATGIAADAAILTLVQFHRFSDRGTVWRWAGAVGFTHWLFPFVGFVGSWWLLRFPVLQMAVFLLAAALMAGLTRAAFRNALGGSGAEVEEGHRFPTWGLVWTVSLDALLTGPGKAPAAAAWGTGEIVFSFVLVGFGVFAWVAGAATLARVLAARLARGGLDGATRRRIDHLKVLLVLLETGAFATFSALGLARALAVLMPAVPAAPVVLLGPVLALGVWWHLRRRLHDALSTGHQDPASPPDLEPGKAP